MGDHRSKGKVDRRQYRTGYGTTAALLEVEARKLRQQLYGVGGGPVTHLSGEDYQAQRITERIEQILSKAHL